MITKAGPQVGAIYLNFDWGHPSCYGKEYKVTNIAYTRDGSFIDVESVLPPNQSMCVPSDLFYSYFTAVNPDSDLLKCVCGSKAPLGKQHSTWCDLYKGEE